MSEFEKPNTSNDWICPICKTSEEEPVVLIVIDGTIENNLGQAEQFHKYCVIDNLVYFKDQGYVALKI